MGSIKRGVLGVAGVVLASLVVAGVMAGSAFAVEPWWHLSGSTTPGVLAPGGEGTVIAVAENAGDRSTGGAVTFTDTLPAGVTAQSVAFYASNIGFDLDLQAGLGACEVQPGQVRCTYPEFLAALFPYNSLEMQIKVQVAGNVAPGVVNQIEASGGEAPAASVGRALQIEGGAVPFGVNDFDFTPEEEGGAVDTRAGSHPFQVTSTIVLNQNTNALSPPALSRELGIRLPAGLVGNATVIPQCSGLVFGTLEHGINKCPESTAVGVVSPTVDEPQVGLIAGSVPLFNLVPSHGEPARFGFTFQNASVILDTSVRSGGDYGVNVVATNITELVNVLNIQLTFWGVPGDPRHDQSRGWGCVAGEFWEPPVAGAPPCQLLNESDPAPFLALPTACSLPFVPVLEGDAWPTSSDPQGLSLPSREAPLTDGLGRVVGLTGCDQLPFAPSISVTPDTQAASTPTGLTVGVHVPQDTGSTPGGLAESAVKDVQVALPAGVQVNPSSADGLEACSESQVGYAGTVGGTAQFTPGPAGCPDASKIGTIEGVKIPLIANPLTGSVYLASPHANPFGSLLAVYLVAEDPVSGVRATVAGEVSLDPVTGQLTATFQNLPQAPIEDIKLHFFGGSRAPLATPATCGAYTTSAVFSPWSETAPVDTSSGFQVNSGLGGTPCPGGVLPFAASLTAGSTNIQAGGFTPFTVTMGRQDNEQALSGLQLHMPPGLLGMLSSVKQCPEPQASQGTCGAESLLGHTTVSAGIGSDPFTITGGQVFITGPYHGAPFGLSIAVPAKAGPFDLGSGPCDCVVVRAKIEVDPHTAQITVVSDPFPTILEGIPLQVKHINVTIDRVGFTFNPTDCNALSATGTLTGIQGGSATDTVPFQVTNCARLPFKPSFKVSTQAKTSKKQGASLDVKVGSGLGQANLAKVAVTLPRQLPARLTTIQQACLAALFNANPANCPAGSNIGTATAKTPVLAASLSGPVYLVSHGGAAFPDVVVILQGEGVTLDLTGSIDIKHDITSSTFATIPDAPISSFELKLPEGPHSGLAAVVPAKAKGSLCGTALSMPTTMTGQNGAVLKQATKIAVTGCAKAKRAKPKPKAKKKGK